MKFEQLLKIICKIYFLLLLFLLWLLSSEPPRPLFVSWGGRGERWRPQCKQTHGAAMMLIVFPKHILGPYPLCWELSIYPFWFHIVLKHLGVYVRSSGFQTVAQVGRLKASPLPGGSHSFLLTVLSVRDLLSDWWGPLIAFHLWWHLSRIWIRNAVWNEIRFTHHSIHSLNSSAFLWSNSITLQREQKASRIMFHRAAFTLL